MLTAGVDVARGGKDNTVFAAKHAAPELGHGLWFDKPKVMPGSQTPDGATVAGLVVANLRDSAPIAIDVIGVGASPYDVLRGMRFQIQGVNVSEAPTSVDHTGRLLFFNLRTQLWWRMREALDPQRDTGICLPPDPQLLRELCAPRWSVSGKTVKVESREDIIKRIGKSPDLASAYILALTDVPKLSVLQAARGQTDVLNYDPMGYRE